MLGVILGVGVGAAVFVGTWAASGLDVGHVSTGAVTLGTLGALGVGVLVALLGNTGHQTPE